MTEDIIKDADQRMKKSLEALKQEMQKTRTGRASTSLLEHVMVNFYGADMPINQVANVNVLDPRTLSVSAWDKNAIPAIEKAIHNSDLGLNPVTAGEVIRIPLPPLTEERRKELIKVVRAEGERARVAIRNIRRDANHTCKELVKDKTLSEDDEHKAADRIQKLTDHYVAQIDSLLDNKEKEMLEI